MNAYAAIAFLVTIIASALFFELGPAIQQFAGRIADVPQFTDKGSKPHLFDLAVRLAYLITIVGIAKILLTRKKDD